MPDSPAPRTYALRPGEVHVWKIALASTHAAAAELMDPLSEAEKERAARFRFEKEQARFISGRGTLRLLLSRYTGIPADKIDFRYEAHGKPALIAAPEWQFNLSHSRDTALVALCRERPVGIDLERIDPDFPRAEVAPDILDEEELREFESVPPVGQAEYFFAIWTLKEALLKALGKGFSMEPRNLRMHLDEKGEPEVISAPPEFQGVSLFRLFPRPGFAAALAVLGGADRLEIFDFPPAAD